MGVHADTDGGPTKSFLVEHKSDPAIRKYYDLSFAKRPAVELYDCQADPDNVNNLADDPKYAQTIKMLSEQLAEYLGKTDDPRFTSQPVRFDEFPYQAEYLERETWSARRVELAEVVEDLTEEIDELREDGEDRWAKPLESRLKRIRSILSMVDQVLELEKELEKAEANQNVSEVEQIEGRLETLVETIERTEHIGELEGRLAELKIISDELSEDGADKERQRLRAFVADQEKLLVLVRELHRLAEADDDKRIEELEEQIVRLEEPMELRVQEFYLERELIEAREEGENVQELVAELQEIRNALSELHGESN
jgi:hypothetical protein